MCMETWPGTSLPERQLPAVRVAGDSRIEAAYGTVLLLFGYASVRTGFPQRWCGDHRFGDLVSPGSGSTIVARRALFRIRGWIHDRTADPMSSARCKLQAPVAQLDRATVF